VTRARGNALQNALARYLSAWWPHAESAGAGRNGSDVLGTPGVVWECKTAVDFKRDFRPAAWVRQSMGFKPNQAHSEALAASLSRDLPIVVYFPPGVGETRTEHAMAIVPLHVMMQVLQEAGYAPAKQEV
jgi:hypothetical protein